VLMEFEWRKHPGVNNIYKKRLATLRSLSNNPVTLYVKKRSCSAILHVLLYISSDSKGNVASTISCFLWFCRSVNCSIMLSLVFDFVVSAENMGAA